MIAEGGLVTPATEGARTSTTQIVLVHGACHGPWCWEPIVEPVRAHGFGVQAPELPMTSLDADVDVVRRAVRQARESGPVLLVGHSYGGVVITAAGHDADELLYCTATMPDNDQSATDVFPRLFTPELADALETSEDGTELVLHPERSIPAFFNRCTAEVIGQLRPRLRPIHQVCFTEPVGPAAWRTVPATYIVCSDDHAMSVEYQEACATALGDSIHLDSDHSLFYTATAELISRVVEIAERLAQAAPSAVDRTRHKLADAACAAYDIGADDRGFGHRRR